ncbi:hypothetical protein TYRP_014306 [Tyrophagus putrescentiae]|nr:hypothetical protein TYRP_014306 [Tyrophagus putrescentiae]
MYKESTSNNSSSNPATKSGTSGAVATLGTSSSLCDDEPVLDSVLELLRINTVSAADDDEDGEGLDEMVSPSLTTSSPDLLTSSSACSSLHSSQSTSPLPPLSPTSPSMLLASSTHSESFSGCSSPNTMTVSAEDHHLHQHFPSSGSPSSTTATTIAASGSSHSPAISIPPVSASGSSAAGTTTKRRYRLAKKRAMPPRSNSTPLPPDSESGSVVASSCPNSASSGGGGGGSGSGSGSGSFSSRMSRFAYSESLQRRIISSFLRQNSAEDITATGKKKSSSGGGGKLVDSDAVSVPPLDEIKASHSSGGILRNTKAVSLSNIKSSSVPSIVKRADSKEGKDSPSKGTPVAEQSFSRRNTGESAIAEKPNFLLMNRAKPKLSTLTNEPNMRSTVGGCGYSLSSLNISSNISTITSSPPTSIPSIVVNECASNGPSPAPGDQPGDETENGKFPDDFK